MSTIKQPEVWTPQVKFDFFVDNSSAKRRRGGSMRFASATAALSESVLNSQSASLSAPPSPPPPPRVDTKPASDVLAGAMARAASQGTIHPLDTLKVRMQSQGGTAAKRPLSKIAKLIPPAGADAAVTAAKAQKAVSKAIPKVASLYRGVIGAASGAGIAIGTYFAFYGAASNMLSTSTTLAPGQIAFVAGGMAAAGGSVVKVPLAVCIRSVQAGVYPNVFKAAGAITEAAGVRGLFTGYLPTLLEDVPDMAFKFAAYETLRQVHRRLNDGRKANVQVSAILMFTSAVSVPVLCVHGHMISDVLQCPFSSVCANFRLLSSACYCVAMVSIVRLKAFPFLIVWSLWHALSTSNFMKAMCCRKTLLWVLALEPLQLQPLLHWMSSRQT